MLDNSFTKIQNKKLTFSQRLQRFQNQHSYTAYLYATISNICLVVMQMNMKIASKYVSPIHALAIRGFFLLLINNLVLHYNKMDFNIKQSSIFIILVKRNIFSAFTVSMFLAPLKYIPAGTVNALFNTAPIIVCFVQAIKYKKSLNFKHFVLTVISFVGILLIIQPDFLFGKSNSNYEQYKYMMFFSLAAAFTNSISMTYLHELKGKVPGTVAFHYFYIGQCIFNSLVMMFQEQNTQVLQLDLKFYLSITGLTIFAYFTQNFMTRAIMLKKPSYIMPFGYVTIILSSIFDNLFFGNSFGTLSIIGMLLTSSGLLVKLLVPEEQVIVPLKIQAQNNKNKSFQTDPEESFSIDV